MCPERYSSELSRDKFLCPVAPYLIAGQRAGGGGLLSTRDEYSAGGLFSDHERSIRMNWEVR
jgi:hypothetical protein